MWNVNKLRQLKQFDSAKTVSDFGRIFLELGRVEVKELLEKNNIVFREIKSSEKLLDYILKYDIALIKSFETKENYIKFMTGQLREYYSDEDIKKYYYDNYDKLIEKKDL